VKLLRHPDEFIEPPRVLLLGNDGGRERQIATAIAAASERPLIAVHALNLKGLVNGESSDRIRRLFGHAHEQAPCLLFIGGIDWIATKRGSPDNDEHSDEIVSELLVQIMAPGRNFLLMASANNLENLDSAIDLRFVKKIVLSRVTSPEHDPWKHLVLRPSVKEQLSDLLRSIQSGGSGFNTFIFGPPGTGKTEIICSLVKSSELRIVAVGAHDFRGQYLGQSAVRVRKFFEKIRSDSPTILYIDLGQAPYSDDSLLPPRSSDSIAEEILYEFLEQLYVLSKKHAPVFIIGETFHIDRVDPAVVSRFGVRIEIPLPDESERRQILKQMIRTSAVAEVTTDVDEISAHLARSMPGASGRDLNYVVRTAVGRAQERSAHRDQVPLSAQDLVAAAQESRMYVKE
jgi:AAA+ superfamily predicted ATPase